MSASRPVIVHHPDGTPGQEVPRMERDQQLEREGRWASWIRIPSGNVTTWHHHAGNDTYVYVSRGSVTIEYGSGGDESVVAGAGDFFHVRPRTIHRETIGTDVDFDGFVLRLGGAPERVDVDGPDAAGGSA
jgi:oxalate decarboxylase/phosphoglucose isomerase-like protein (cupin superfamily)